MCLTHGLAVAQKTVYNFERLSTENGLPSNVIHDIIQDRQGFIWLGTDKGLCRYDGYRMKVFVHDTDNPHSISSNAVKRIYEGHDGKIWIASLQTGLSCYDPTLPDQEAFTNYRSNLKDSSGLLNNELFAVYEDQKGFIWVAGLDTDLQRLDPKTGLFETIALGKKTSGHKSYFRFMPDKENKYLWLGSRYNGFFRFDPITREAKQYNYADLTQGNENSIGAFASSKNKLWVSYYNLGLCMLDLQDNTFTPDVFGMGPNKDFYDNTLFTLCFDNNDMLWSGHTKNGIYLYNTKNKEAQRIGWNELTPADTLPAHVEVIFFDKSNIGWLGTSGKGLLKYDPYLNLFNQFNSFSAKEDYGNVVHLVEDKEYLWFHTLKGIGKYNTASRKTEFFIEYKKYSLNVGEINLANEVMYISGTNKGVWYVDDKERKLKQLAYAADSKAQAPLDINTILAENKNEDSVLWIGSWNGGLYRYDNKTKALQRFTSKDGLPDNKVIQLGRDPRGYLWIATQGHGVALIRDQQKMNFETFINSPQDQASLPSNTILCFYTDSKNRFWMGTSMGGLVEVVEDKDRINFRYYRDDKKLAYQGVRAIAEDKSGDLIMYTDDGIAVFNPANGRINHYTEKASLHPLAFPISTVTSNSRHEVLMGTHNGFLSSNKVHRQPAEVAQAAITGFKLFDKDYSFLLYQKQKNKQEEITLSYDQNFFTIEFTVPHYSETKNIRFAYQLIGIDKTWRYASSDPSTTYTDVKGGDYIFQVKAANSQGVWNDTPTLLKITITPPFWATLWFRAAVIFLVCITIYLIHLYRMRQLLIIHQIRESISKDLHDDVGATLSSIRILSEVAHKKLKESQLEYSRQLMAKVSEQAAEMGDNMSDIIWTFNPYNDHLEKMIQRLQLQFHDLCEAKGIVFRTSINSAATSISLSLDVRKNIYLICKEAINNSIKYAEGNCIEVIVSGNVKQLRISIQDNGKGFIVPAESTGNGIRNMTMRASEIKADFVIESAAEKGTHVKINFNPMKNGHTYFDL